MKATLVLGGLAVLATAPACTTWRPVAIPSPAAGEEVRFRHLRVTERGVGKVELRDARVTADSVVGRRGEEAREEGRVAIGTDHVRLLERPRFSWQRTLVVIVAAGAAVVWQIVQMANAAV